MTTAIAENVDVADRFRERQLNPATWTQSLKRCEVSPAGMNDLPARMRAHLDEIVGRIPARLEIFGEGAAAFPQGLGLKIVMQSKVSEGAWNLRVQGRDPDYGLKSAEFRLQWSGEYAGRYHLFVLSSRGESGVIPTIVDDSSVVRELAIFTIGRQIHRTPLCRD